MFHIPICIFTYVSHLCLTDEISYFLLKVRKFIPWSNIWDDSNQPNSLILFCSLNQIESAIEKTGDKYIRKKTEI